MNYKFEKEEKLYLILQTINYLTNKTITRIQKVLFIFEQEYKPGMFLYVPNNFGPNSFELLDEINFLVNNNFANENKSEKWTVYSLTFLGQKKIKQIIDRKKYVQELNILKQILDWANKNDKWLLEYIYEVYPKFTVNSLIKDDVKERLTYERKAYARRSIDILKEKIQKSRNN